MTTNFEGNPIPNQTAVASTHNTLASLTREQLVAKIAYDITRYNNESPQAKLSLLQDLIIETLPHVEQDSPDYLKLMSVRCHKPPEDVVTWLDDLMHVYLSIPKVRETLATLRPADLDHPY